jgi:murein DD-endopeptidase MepM/ murein hydrolase activator NlpD
LKQHAWIGVVFLCALSGRLDASEVVLEGTLVQGGLVVGQAEPGTSISLAGRRVRISPKGRFLIGFGRNAPERVVLDIVLADGGKEKRTLKIAQRKYQTQRIDGLAQKQVAPRPQDTKRIKKDNAGISEVRRKDTDKSYFTSGFLWPLEGRISGVFGSQRILNGTPKSPHNGVDIAAKKGEAIRAIGDGVVALVHQDMFYTGKTLMVDHGHGLSSVYAHMSEILVEKGDRIEKGSFIGKVGATGRATGPHLHWGISLFSTHLDPELFVPQP